MKKHVKMNTCNYQGNMKLKICEHKGLGVGADFEMASYCTKQFEKSDDIHKNLKCNECPDFKPYEYTLEVL